MVVLFLAEVLEKPIAYLRMCWLKAVAGGWHTTTRMHEDTKWPCIFGCEGAGNLTHYVECPVLWQIAHENYWL